MKKINIFTLLLSILFFAGCDYNEDNFPGYDSGKITDVVIFEGVYDGTYPEQGYFSDKDELGTAIDGMLKKIYLYNDKGSTAKVTALFGDITPGFSAADEAYTLAKEDYDSMGEENGQPGKYDNFDGNMDVDGYLIDFITKKYASLAQGKIVSVSYEFYKEGTKTNSYKKEVSGWYRVELNAFSANLSYTMVTEDYDAMGTESGKPGRYDNFDANMDVDYYVSVMLNQKYPYALENTTAKVSYKYYISNPATERFSYYKVSGGSWTGYDPYASTIDVTAKIAEMEFDGTNWILKRLLGGTWKYKFVTADYQKLVDWVKVNKPAYMSTQNDTDEYYYGAAPGYGNINNKPGTWKGYYNVNGEYDGKSDEDMYVIMDSRIAEGIMTHILPDLIPTPDPGLSYQITYKVYGGRKGDGDYMQAFMYNEEEGAYEVVSSASVKQ